MKTSPAQPSEKQYLILNELYRDAQDRVLSKFPKKFRLPTFILIGTVFIFISVVRFFNPDFLVISQKKDRVLGYESESLTVSGENNIVLNPVSKTTEVDRKTTLFFLPINGDNWSGLDHFIVDQNNLWKIKNKNTTVDPVVRYIENQSQKGGFAFSLLWTPQTSKPNLNIYFGGYFREEIGSGDLSTSRLFTNNIGCENGSIQNATESARYIMTAKKTRFGKEVLTKDRIDTKGKVIVTLMVFQRDNQNVASLAINYLSKVTGKRETYGFENMEAQFEIGSLCDRKHVPNLSASSELIGFGIAPNTADNAIKIEGYFFQPFSIEDYNSKNLILPVVE